MSRSSAERSSGSSLRWRTRNWQISLDGCVVGTPHSGATHALAIFLLTTAHGQRVVSGYQSDGARRSIYDTDTEQVKLDKLDAVLALASTSKQDAALFAEMLSLPNDGRYPALKLAPQQRRQRTLEALSRRSRRLHAKIRC